MAKLAIKGGNPVRTKQFPGHYMIGEEERQAVERVMRSGELSRFLGGFHKDFYGGPEVQQFEKDWAHFTDAKYAISVNSNTSGLFAAIGAAGVGPGDEVIVSPYTMAASATSIIAYNAIPVFADIKPDIFTLDPDSVRSRITERTRAIMVVDIFGHPADLDEILEIAKEHDLVVIEDAAQIPGGVYRGRKVGGISHMAVFSLNYHKHIHTGEGGVVTTNDDRLAEKLQLIRNHGEAVVGDKGVADLINTFGFNFRLTEIQAAIGIEQLKKLPGLLEARIENAEYLNDRIGSLPGFQAPAVYEGCVHTYYVQAFLFDQELIGCSRETFVDAVCAELPTATDRDWPLVFSGYGTPLYMLPMYQNRIAYKGGCPWECGDRKSNVSYAPGICPVVEDLEAHRLIGSEFMRPPCDLSDMKEVADAFEKVYENRAELR